MTLSAPRVSVLMAVHDARRYLDRCIRSIVRQTVSDFEFIIVDDGSTDGSSRMLEKWSRKESRIRLIARENRGLTKSLNEAFAVARGEYVARMDADDVSRPDRFALQLDYLAAHPECVAVGSEVMQIDPEGWPLGLGRHPRTHAEIEDWILQANGGALTHPTLMMRAEALRKVGGYREKFTTAQDLDLYLRLAEIGQLANLPEVLLQWRQSRQSVNFTKSQTWAEMKRMALQDAMDRRHIAVDIDAVLAADCRPPDAPRLAWGRYALNAHHPWTALKNGCWSLLAENNRPAARQLLADTLSHLYWREFREKISGKIRNPL